LHHIVAMIQRSALSAQQQELAIRIFTRLGEAEAKVHGTTIEKVHFHEVGAVDSIADIVGTAIAWDLLGIERASASAVPTGCGSVKIAHGVCSIPAPATALLLQGIPVAESHVTGELTTPTGAAILSALVDSYGPLPAMTISAIGCGAGSMELEEQPNLLRIMVGESREPLSSEQVWSVETNLDDISGELVGYCVSRLWDAGALDVSTAAIQMKKNRPGVTVRVLCQASDVGQIESILFRETATLGVRRWKVERTTLERKSHAVTTPWGEVQGIVANVAGGEPIFSPEFESCQRLALEQNLPLRVVYEAARQAFQRSPLTP
jgi:uncharacterized protein (TIGR00299 family) protein